MLPFFCKCVLKSIIYLRQNCSGIIVSRIGSAVVTKIFFYVIAFIGVEKIASIISYHAASYASLVLLVKIFSGIKS